MFQLSILSSIVWDPMKEIIKGIQPPVWYSVLFAFGFIIGYQIMVHIFKKEGKDPLNVDTLTVHMVLATIIGARLGHLVFYEPDRFLADPLMFFRTWEGGLASHGAAIVIPLALFLYRNYFVRSKLFPLKDLFKKQKRTGQSYLWILDRIAITVALAAVFIRVGNFVNSEIEGKPTDSDYGVVFGRVGEIYLAEGINGIEDAEASKGTSTETLMPGIIPVDIEVTFTGTSTAEQDVRRVLENQVKSQLLRYPVSDHYKEIAGVPLNYDLTMKNRLWVATVHTFGISRHPAQLYEAATSLILFFILLALWMKYKEKTPEGLLLGIFFLWIFGFRFFHETFKENQVAFEDNMTFNMGQLLSIPLVLAGIFILARVAILKNKKSPKH
ncbi:MAG: phosphatidylglycerol:prolipoprotein diacylglycerol transferase [Roseivirga sp.]|jgi:phosphatidylglycerol:prolipoprotein diacylglycerol transferase